jgi:hypothetical protein
LYLFFEGLDDAVGEHGDAVVAAFSVVDDDAVVFKVYVFDAQAKAFHDAQSAAVHDLGHEFGGSGYLGDDGFGFLFGEDVGYAFAFFGADEFEGFAFELDVEDVAVEEEDGADGLISLAPNARTVWVEAEAFLSTTRWVMNWLISWVPISFGWRLLW